ncbi:ThiF family adenylyltransferase [Corynebacterium sp. 335C]
MRPAAAPGAPLTDAESARYARHLTLDGIGAEGQRRLRGARVLVVGAGGLGSATIPYLAAAGAGHLTILDGDVVEESNLQRQVIHADAAVGRPKAESARESVLRLDPSASVDAIIGELTPDNAVELFAAHDIVVDGADNFATRYLSNDAAELTGTPLVWGTIHQFSGQVSVFWPGEGPMLRDLYPDIPPADSVPSCAAGGVLGAMAGLVGSMMVVEAVKVLTGCGEPAVGRLLMLDAAAMRLRELSFGPDPDRAPVTSLDDAAASFGDRCRLDAAEDADRAAAATVGAAALAAELAGGSPPLVVDVREAHERGGGHVAGDVHVPLGRVLDGGRAAIDDAAGKPADAGGRGVVVYCRSGMRSARAAAALGAADAPGGPLAVRSLAGGHLAWAAGPGAGA